MLVPGAWHGRWCRERVIPLLTAAGHRVAAARDPDRAIPPPPLEVIGVS